MSPFGSEGALESTSGCDDAFESACGCDDFVVSTSGSERFMDMGLTFSSHSRRCSEHELFQNVVGWGYGF